jgi:ABC-type transport system involved in multi-copper enzyme maturation permease subunit
LVRTLGECLLFVGPVFSREAVVAPRRGKHYAIRSVYVTTLLVLMCTAWLALAGTQVIRNIGDTARFGSVLFVNIMAPLQLAFITFVSALVAASAVAQEKDRRTLILLLMTQMSNAELVLGKLLASLLNVFSMLLGALPVFMMVALFGGVAIEQVVRVFAVTLTTALAAGSLGSLFALWREKTFQTLAMTALTLVMWLAVWEAVLELGRGVSFAGVPVELLVAGCSPFRAVLAASQPQLVSAVAEPWYLDGANLFVCLSLIGTAVLNLISIAMVRIWNPSRELRPGQAERSEQGSIWGVEHDLEQDAPAGDRAQAAEQARAGHVDARLRATSARTRRVWDNPILWREVCTWAYGRKVLVIRVAYLVVFAMAAIGLYWSLSPGGMAGGAGPGLVPTASVPLATLLLVSLVLVNALAVTSVTNERDGQSLDLLLASDLSPKEFVFGKIGGVFWVTKEMVLLPMLLCGYLWWQGGLSSENLVYVLTAVGVLYVFVNTLGIHCGMNYANSRSAIGVSLGVVFLLFLGVITCMLIMISFQGSFQTQLTPFLAFILGGSVGLYVSLGYRNPSAAIQLASLLLPLATFYSITSFLLQHSLAVFLVTTVTYGFTTAAMIIPAVYEFDIAMGRTKTPGEE